MLGGLIRGQALAEITSNLAIGKKWRTRRRFCLARNREIQHNSLKLRAGETKRERVEQFAAPYLAAQIVRGIWLRNWTIFRQNAIGKKNRAVRLTCRSGQQRRDWYEFDLAPMSGMNTPVVETLLSLKKFNTLPANARTS